MIPSGEARDRVIVALDCSAAEAYELADRLDGAVRWLKVGMTLFYEQGPAIVEGLLGRGFDIFLDLKLHDIPHQVEGAARSVAGLGVRMLTVHASGGEEMMRAAVDGAAEGARRAGVLRPDVLAVTVLTSMNDAMLSRIGVSSCSSDQVNLLGSRAFESGVDGVVCSPQEAASIRAIGGESALVVTPGVRPAWSTQGDQQRIMTPRDATLAGASHLVIGRPITEAADPAATAQRIIQEMEGIG